MITQVERDGLIHRSDLTGRTAIYSKCFSYRYALSIPIAAAIGVCMFLMLNPSTATELINDPTIRRCIDFAKRWGFGIVTIGNLFAWRSTDPLGLLRPDDPIGPYNDEEILRMAGAAKLVIFAWGAGSTNRTVRNMTIARASRVTSTLRHLSPRHLGFTEGGQPRHPLMLKKSSTPQLFTEST